MEGDPDRIAQAAARTLLAVEATAFAATISVQDPALAETAVSQDLLGPRTVDPRSLPPIVIAEDDESRADLTVGRVLGQGGMGVVLLARQRSLQREVALKRVRDPSTSHHGALLREAAFTGYLEHPNIVPVHALGRDATGAPVLVMKRIEGTTLATMIHDPTHASWARAEDDRLGFVLRALRGVCDALAFAHARGVLHRDVKPENVMLGAFGEVYLLDWGIAVRRGDPLSDESIVGTPVYMAPEMLRPGTEPLDERTDVYLVGGLLHEWLTGKPPHQGRTMHEVLLSVARSSPPDYPPSIPEELADIARRALHADRDQRFASAEALGQALQAFERHRAAAALARAAMERLVELESAIARRAAPSEVEPLFHECRFGFEQSLRAWPENERARNEWRRALVAMTRYQLTRRNLASAAGLLATIAEPPPELSEAFATLERELAQEAGEHARLRRLEHEMDPSVAEGTRLRAVKAMAAVLAVFAVSLVTAFSLGGFRPSAGGMVALMVPGFALAGGIAYRYRHDLFKNRVNKQMALTIAFTIFGVATNRTLGFVYGRTFADIASTDCLILATVAAVSALSLRRVYLVPAALFFVASMICPRAGALAFLPILLAAITSVATVVRSPARLRAPLLDESYSG